MSTVFLNGHFMPLEQATISVLDRGFLFGDGVYEVIPVYGHEPLALDRHLTRLDHSLAGIRLTNPHTTPEWGALFNQLIATEPAADQSIYLQITRGVAPRDHGFPSGVSPTVFAMNKPLIPPPAPWLTQGIGVITRRDDRWLHCDLKTTALLANVLLRQEALDVACAETILLRDGYLTEGAASNIFVVRNGTLLAPPPGPLLLPGITADLVLDLARTHDIPFQIGPISETTLRQADEILMTSSTREIVPITRLDDAPVGPGIPGPLGVRLRTLYQTLKPR